MTKYELKKIATKQKIIEAFWTIYAKNGIEKTTIKEITALAKCNRSTFYAHFTDVYSLLEEAEDSILLSLRDLPPINIESEDEHSLAAKAMFSIYENNAKYLTILLGENGDPRFQRKMKDAIKPLMKQQLIKNGLDDNAALDYSIEYNLSGAIGLMMYITSQDQQLTMEEVLPIIQHLQQSR